MGTKTHTHTECDSDDAELTHDLFGNLHHVTKKREEEEENIQESLVGQADI